MDKLSGAHVVVGWGFRKSFNLGGGIRVNLSKSGLGLSGGFKGFRVSTNNRGSYVNIGGNGLYYRKKIGPGYGAGSVRIPTGNQAQPHSRAYVDPNAAFRIPTADVEDLVDATSADTLAAINETVTKPSYAWVAYSAIGLMILVFLFVAPIAALVLGILSAYPICLLAVGDKRSRVYPLFYELDAGEQNRWNQRKQALRALSMSLRIWRVETTMGSNAWKDNAGATQLITRRPITITEMNPPSLATNIKAICLGFSNQMLVFLPDRLYVYQGNRYGAVSYQELKVEVSSSSFVESDPVPSDATITGYSYLHPNRNGGPDRRYNYNPQIPIVDYAELRLWSDTGFFFLFQVSSTKAASEFASLFVSQKPPSSSNYRTNSNQGASHGSHNRPGSSRTPPPRQPSNQPPAEWFYGVLGVKPSCTRDEASSAYRNLAKQYHPDQVSHLAPEFRTIAEERMKMINEAYAALKKAKDW